MGPQLTTRIVPARTLSATSTIQRQNGLSISRLHNVLNALNVLINTTRMAILETGFITEQV